MGYFSIVQFRKETKKARIACSSFARFAALAKFVTAKRKFFQEFYKDKITQELKGKEAAGNISGTLGGKRPNLYGFIGFMAGEDPIETLAKILDDKIQLSETPIIKDFKTVANYLFEVEIPNMEELASLTPYPSEKMVGSWLEDIETGISGLTRYIYWRLNSPKSRSGFGLQNKYWDLRSDEFKPRPYLSALLNNFLSGFDKKK